MPKLSTALAWQAIMYLGIRFYLWGSWRDGMPNYGTWYSVLRCVPSIIMCVMSNTQDLCSLTNHSKPVSIMQWQMCLELRFDGKIVIKAYLLQYKRFSLLLLRGVLFSGNKLIVLYWTSSLTKLSVKWKIMANYNIFQDIIYPLNISQISSWFGIWRQSFNGYGLLRTILLNYSTTSLS